MTNSSFYQVSLSDTFNNQHCGNNQQWKVGIKTAMPLPLGYVGG